ncbi:hypothetical protein EW026_g956 [Hermanssonia centrifuga]|uniref:Glutathione S-transferase n=1 Tax=Hermanssonia centrifuga TaxID=98765 RepID=A0A4S4KXL8_9APHY|nr:hypothetical protein EW026_g956 [Hermanssonia centrifuga]
MSAVPKASLYYYKQSIWASVALLALEEKGYAPDEIDLKEVDLFKGENFSPSYLRINNNGTYGAHTRAPALTPATIAFSTASNKVIELLHSEPADPNALLYVNAKDDASLRQLAQQLLPFLTSKGDALEKLIEENKTSQIHVSEKTAQFWELKKLAVVSILDVMQDADKDTAQLEGPAAKKREDYFRTAQVSWAALKEVLIQLHKEIIGPYVLGDQISVADLHLAAWLARIAKLSSATGSEEGNDVVNKIEAHIGGSFSLPKDFSVAEARRRAGLPSTNVSPTERQSRFAAFWDAIRERPSWKKVYADGLH